jgi:hypothetical protein
MRWTDTEIELAPHLERAVQLKALTRAEAWALTDETLEFPERPYPPQLIPVLERLHFLEMVPPVLTQQ